MSLEIGFGKRLTNIVSLTNAFTLLGKDANEARSTARDLEEEIRTRATSIEEYHQKLEKAIFALQRAKDSLREEQGDSMEEIEILNHEGPSFGSYQFATFHADGLMSTVFKAEAKGSNAPMRIVALKVTHPAMMTPPHNSEREARLLVKARSEHVVPLLETFHEPGGQFILVFPFLRQDLENLLRSRRLDARQTGIIFEGLFKALEYIHSVGMIHRDVKPSNILLKTMYGPVYLADFGITWDPEDKDSEPADAKITDVGTTCYRPLELLFGHRSYDSSLDMWAAGCVVAEMIKDDHTPLFDAGPLGSELSLIRSVFTTLGTPNDEIWPSAHTFPDWGKMKFQTFPAKSWRDLLPGANEKAVDFVIKTVCYEATRRLTAEQALDHEIRNDWYGPGN